MNAWPSPFADLNGQHGVGGRMVLCPTFIREEGMEEIPSPLLRCVDLCASARLGLKMSVRRHLLYYPNLTLT